MEKGLEQRPELKLAEAIGKFPVIELAPAKAIQQGFRINTHNHLRIYP